MKTLAIIIMLLASPAIAEGFQNPYLQPFNPMPDLMVSQEDVPEQTLEEAWAASTDEATINARKALNPPADITAADIINAYEPPPLPERNPLRYNPNEPETDL